MITVLSQPCWELHDQQGFTADGDNSHHATEADAYEALKTLREATEPDDEEVQQLTPARLDKPCVTAVCSDCAKTVGDDEFDVTHFPDAETAAFFAGEADYVVIGTDAWCDDCRTNPHVLVPDPQSPDCCLRCNWEPDEHLETVMGPLLNQHAREAS